MNSVRLLKVCWLLFQRFFLRGLINLLGGMIYITFSRSEAAACSAAVSLQAFLTPLPGPSAAPWGPQLGTRWGEVRVEPLMRGWTGLGAGVTGCRKAGPRSDPVRLDSIKHWEHRGGRSGSQLWIAGFNYCQGCSRGFSMSQNDGVSNDLN